MTVTRTQPADADAVASSQQVPRERLSIHGSLLLPLLDRGAVVPPRWRTPDFARMVDLVRSHLRPITATTVLERSYTSEHFHVFPVGPPPSPQILLSRDATEVAYAMRWLEIQSGVSRAPWAEHFADN